MARKNSITTGKPKPTRLYLRTDGSHFRRLLWLQNNKPNEMLLGLYGFSGQPAVMQYLWPEYEFEDAQLHTVKYRFDDAQKVNQRIDHITCHADGRFHIKKKGGNPLYIQEMQRTEPLGANTGLFLEFILHSDSIESYALVFGQPKNPHVCVDLEPNNCIVMRGMFAGVNHDVERVMLDTMTQFAGMHTGVTLTSGTIKGVVAFQAHRQISFHSE
jgi:hypothetical protein